jgi:hypothetical protein
VWRGKLIFVPIAACAGEQRMTLEGYDYKLQEVVRRDDVTLVTM